MKYLILSTFEVDGHSSADCVIVEGKEDMQKFVKQLRWDEIDEYYYEIQGEVQERDGSTVLYGDYECGQWSIKIVPFKTYKQILNKELYTRTG